MTTRLRALLVSKETVLERETRRGRALQGEPQPPVPQGGPAESYWKAVLDSHARHHHTVEQVEAALTKLGWDYDVVSSQAFTGPNGHDVVITLGGDGMVLHASHQTIGVPLLGINSDPERSIGYFCATGGEGALAVLEAFGQERLETFRLHRLKIELDGTTAGPPALNDVLVANANPGETSRYSLVAGSRVERQKSSGIWISTPAGSTAGIRSAGGVVLPLHGAQLQYLVREPVFSKNDHYELLRGVRDLDEGLMVVSHMPAGYAYIDGPHVQVPLPLGATLRVSAHQPLVILGLEPARRER
jgi:NAD+ kinase